MKMKKRKMKKVLATCLAASLVLSQDNPVQAKTVAPSLVKKISIMQNHYKNIALRANGTTVKKVTWKSSNENVVTVKAKNVKIARVTGEEGGTATITATVTYKVKKVTKRKKLACKVVVKGTNANTSTSGQATGIAPVVTSPVTAAPQGGNGDTKLNGSAAPGTTANANTSQTPTGTPVTGRPPIVADEHAPTTYAPTATPETSQVPPATPQVQGPSTEAPEEVETETPTVTDSAVEKAVLLFSEDNTTLTGCQNKNTATLADIPDGVRTIGPMVFYGCEKLEYIIVPDSVKTIHNAAFIG